jgi:riboflavin kinase/FMN adenylyltransferase
VPARPRSAVTIGVYDGLHLGHRRLIEELCRLARTQGLRSVVVTFDPHPASVVRPESAPRQLTDLAQRLELLTQAGVDEVFVLEFTPTRAAESAEEFVKEVLVGELETRLVLVGRDFHFGRNRGGDVALLEKMGAEHGFEVVPYELVGDDQDGAVVSSTRIRELVGSGELAEAARLLGRAYEVRGLVASTEGSEAGMALRVAVAPQILLPPPGRYPAFAGLVGAAAVPLAPVHAVVPEKAGELALTGLAEPWPPGSPVRVSFAATAGP